MTTQANQDAQYMGWQLHYGNLFGGFFTLFFGAFLMLSGPLFNFVITYRGTPPILTQGVGALFVVVGILSLIVFEKRQRKCLRCKRGFESGEAAFPEDLDAQIRPLVRAQTPGSLMGAPVGSRFGTGTHFEFDYCPGCKSVGQLSLLSGPGTRGRYEFQKVLVVGEAAQQFAHICETHERVRDANNAGS